MQHFFPVPHWNVHEQQSTQAFTVDCFVGVVNAALATSTPSTTSPISFLIGQSPLLMLPPRANFNPHKPAGRALWAVDKVRHATHCASVEVVLTVHLRPAFKYSLPIL